MKETTWKELNWAWEAATEKRFDDLALLRFELQKIFAALFATQGVSTDFPKLRNLNPLNPGNGEYE